jgi:antitoxin VapB
MFQPVGQRDRSIGLLNPATSGTHRDTVVYISIYFASLSLDGARDMSASSPRTAKLFWNGRSQAVRLPKEFRFEGDEVEITRHGDQVVLTPIVRERFEDGYWARVDVLAGTDDLSDIEAVGAGLLEPDISIPHE